MMTLALAILVAMGTVLFGTLVGWGIHGLLHRPWSGRLYRAHMTHHLKLYPPKNLVSDGYRDAGKDDGLYVFIPIITVAEGAYMLLVWWAGVPWWGIGLVALESVFIGWLHNHLHEGFHIRGFWLERFSWYMALRARHWRHHTRMNRNLGIMWLGWDRVLGTFDNR